MTKLNSNERFYIDSSWIIACFAVRLVGFREGWSVKFILLDNCTSFSYNIESSWVIVYLAIRLVGFREGWSVEFILLDNCTSFSYNWKIGEH